MKTVLIYCAAGNKRFAEIAINHGYMYGAQLPNKVYFTPYFTDQNWKAPKRDKYMAALERHAPTLATVLDWEHEEQYSEVMSWADEASQYVREAVIIIPKVVGGIKRLPREINGKQVRLGYSASSTFSSTPVSLSEFVGWPVHCLGGGVRIQMSLMRSHNLESADGNYIQNLARKWCQFYSPAIRAKNNGWPMLKEIGMGHIKQDAIYLAFELTCMAVPMAFRGVSGDCIYEMQHEWLKAQGFTPEHKQLSMWSN